MKSYLKCISINLGDLLEIVSVCGAPIPSVMEKLVKNLGKVFTCSLKDKATTQETNQALESWLASEVKSGEQVYLACSKPGSTSMASFHATSGL